MCQKAQANLAKVRETGSKWEFHIPRIDTWGYLDGGVLNAARAHKLSTKGLSSVLNIGHTPVPISKMHQSTGTFILIRQPGKKTTVQSTAMTLE